MEYIGVSHTRMRFYSLSITPFLDLTWQDAFLYAAVTVQSGHSNHNIVSQFYYCRIMQACCDVAFKYAHEREAFGQKIGHFQVVLIVFVFFLNIFQDYIQLIWPRDIVYIQ